MNFKNFTIIIILLVIILLLFTTFNRKSSINDSNGDDKVIPIVNNDDKVEGFDPEERQVDMYKMINTPSTNIAYNVNEKRAGPFGLPIHGDVPMKSTNIGDDWRGVPKPTLDMIARSQTNRDPNSLHRSRFTLRGTLNAAHGLCNQNYAKNLIRQVGKERGEPNRLFTSSWKHNFQNKKNQRDMYKKSSSQIMFGQKYGFPEDVY